MSLKLDDVTLAQRIAAGAGAILKGVRSGGYCVGMNLELPAMSLLSIGLRPSLLHIALMMACFRKKLPMR